MNQPFHLENMTLIECFTKYDMTNQNAPLQELMVETT